MINTPTRFDLEPVRQVVASQPLTVFPTILAIQEVLSRGAYPSSKVSRRFDFLFHEFKAQNAQIEDGLEAISALNDFLYDLQGFKVPTDDKCQIDDYFLGKAMESRQSCALAFSILYREMAHRINLAPTNFMNFPGSSLIKLFYNHQLLFIDPSEEGTLLSITDLQTKLHNRYGQSMLLSSTFLETPTDGHVVNRFLTKLKNLYFDLRRWEELLAVLDLLVWLNPTKMHELKERGLLLYQLGCHEEAKHDLSKFVDLARPSLETDKIRQLVTFLNNPKVTPLYDN